jgi:hypothetical protein
LIAICGGTIANLTATTPLLLRKVVTNFRFYSIVKEKIRGETLSKQNKKQGTDLDINHKNKKCFQSEIP